MFCENWIFAYAKNKGADQLCSNCTTDQRLCSRYTDSKISLLLKSQSFKPLACFCVQVGLHRTWSETRKTGFLTTWLICVRPRSVRDSVKTILMESVTRH